MEHCRKAMDWANMGLSSRNGVCDVYRNLQTEQDFESYCLEHRKARQFVFSIKLLCIHFPTPFFYRLRGVRGVITGDKRFLIAPGSLQKFTSSAF
jgi:hypothetical protein